MNCFYFGGTGTLTLNAWVSIFHSRKTSSKGTHITREKITTSFLIHVSYMAHNINMCLFWLFVGPVWHLDNHTGPILLSSYPLTNIIYMYNMEVILFGSFKLLH